VTAEALAGDQAYLVAHAETTGVEAVLSFDRSIDRIASVERREP
jgi:predicted nucleic acid-binding protein